VASAPAAPQVGAGGQAGRRAGGAAPLAATEGPPAHALLFKSHTRFRQPILQFWCIATSLDVYACRAALAEAPEAAEQRLAVGAEARLAAAEQRIEEEARYAEMQAGHVAQAFRPPSWPPSSAATAMEGVEGSTQLAAEPQAAARGQASAPAAASHPVANPRQQAWAEHVLQNMQGPPAPGQAALRQAAGGKSPRAASPLLASAAYDLY
jgi:hypothetical protein